MYFYKFFGKIVSQSRGGRRHMQPGSHKMSAAGRAGRRLPGVRGLGQAGPGGPAGGTLDLYNLGAEMPLQTPLGPVLLRCSEIALCQVAPFSEAPPPLWGCRLSTRSEQVNFLLGCSNSTHDLQINDLTPRAQPSDPSHSRGQPSSLLFSRL